MVAVHAGSTQQRTSHPGVGLALCRGVGDDVSLPSHRDEILGVVHLPEACAEIVSLGLNMMCRTISEHHITF